MKTPLVALLVLAFVFTASWVFDRWFAPISLYVATNGDDAGPCSRAQPCRSVQAAVDRLPDALDRPYRIQLERGAYYSGGRLPELKGASLH